MLTGWGSPEVATPSMCSERHVILGTPVHFHTVKGRFACDIRTAVRGSILGDVGAAVDLRHMAQGV